MKIKFDSYQLYQTVAVKSVIDIFEGQPLAKSDFEFAVSSGESSISFTEKGIRNNLTISDEQLLNNVRSVQRLNGIVESETLVPTKSDDEITNYSRRNFTIEMETGTGKTYTYIKTIYSLHSVYGFKKFVIVVPSVAIKEGTIKNLQITHEHFQQEFGNPPITFTLYESKNLVALRNFAVSNSIQVLVINIDSFAKDTNVINLVKETGVKPIEFIQSTNPIVIVDEPQNMETEVRKLAMFNLNPLCTLRYSATHRNYYNLIYKLDPVQAYDLGLVKQIEVDGITAHNDYNTAYVKVIGFDQTKKSVVAKIAIHIQYLFDTKEKIVSVGPGDDLFELSGGREIYKDGYIVNSVNVIEGKAWVELSNGLVVEQGAEFGRKSDEIIKYQIERTIYHHFEKEVRYWKKSAGYNSIKVLTLFFIDKVSNYREYDERGNWQKGKFAVWFEELFAEYSKKYKRLYPDLFNAAPPEEYFESKRVHESDLPVLHPDYWNPSKIHNGYFSSDKKGNFKDTKGTTKDDEDVYALIMRHKERLLSLKEPLRFIFSHSALREGWDNPNVFQICTLNETKSEIKKRQEIGRGLRLPVDTLGQQVRDKRINILTVIANETYEQFSAALQKEIQEETNVEFEGRIKNALTKEKVTLSKELKIENYPYLYEIWSKINFKTRYNVKYDTDALIDRTVAELKNYNIVPRTKRPMLESKSTILSYSKFGIEGKTANAAVKPTEKINYSIPDVYHYIQGKVNVTRKSIFEILKQSSRYDELEVNPQMFLDNVIAAIQRSLNSLLVEGVKYEVINGQYYEMDLFHSEEIEMYLTDLFEVTKFDKTLYNFVPIDSNIESEFAKDCETDENVKFYFKLPRGFKVPTPIGNYVPDWAVIFDNSKRIYFVTETKSTFNWQLRSSVENMKIECGQKHFALFEKLDVNYRIATAVEHLY